MGTNEMIRIARASSAGFAMPITAQVGEDPPEGDWARRMLEELREDEDISQGVQDVGPENVIPTEEQRAQIDRLKGEFPEAMDFSNPWDDDGDLPPVEESIDDLGGDYEDDYPMREDDPRYQKFVSEVNRIDDQKERMHEKNMLRKKLRDDLGPYSDWFRDLASSNPNRLTRLAAHLDSIGLHEIADDLDMAALESFAHCGHCEEPLEKDAKKLPWSSQKRCSKCNKRPCSCKGKPCKSSVRTAQAQLAEIGLDEGDVDLDVQDDQAQIVSFDPERGNMIVHSPDGMFKLYTITGQSEDGKPRFEFGGILDSPDDRVKDYTSRLNAGDPSLEGYGESRLPGYLDQLQGGNPNIQQAYASRRNS